MKIFLDVKPEHVLGLGFKFWYIETCARLYTLLKIMFGDKEYALIQPNYSMTKRILYVVMFPFSLLILPIVAGFVSEKLTYKELTENAPERRNISGHSKQAIVYFSLRARSASFNRYTEIIEERNI